MLLNPNWMTAKKRGGGRPASQHNNNEGDIKSPAIKQLVAV